MRVGQLNADLTDCRGMPVSCSGTTGLLGMESTGRGGGLQADVPVRLRRGDAAARAALQVTLLDQVGLDHVLERAAFLAERRGQRLDPDRAAVQRLDDGG